MVNLRCLIFFTFVGIIASEVVNHRACPEDAGHCKINEVRIIPCAEAASGQACRVKRGRSAQIQFDYTADFDAETLTSRAYWASAIDLPFLDMDTDSCKYTTCPVVQNELRSFNQSLTLGKKLPVGTYDVKWKTTADGDKMCCFIMGIKLVK